MFKKILSTLFILFSFISCKYDLVPEPTGNGKHETISSSDKIFPPDSVTASQGLYRICELNWNPVKNAVQYLIFAADSPYDDFIQIGETSGKETTFTIQNEPTGNYKYFIIKAVNFFGTTSLGSKIVCSTTLDVPIITAINKNADGTNVDISWWMGNCSETTYMDSVQYKVIIYSKTKTKISESDFIPGTTTNYRITNLEPSTEYYFQIQANLKDSDQKPELSDLTNAETAHKVLPAAPMNLKVSQGERKDNVEISWDLPEPVDYCDKKTMIYSTHPVYFTIQRKLFGDSDENFTTLQNYIGTIKDAGLTFDCATETTNNSLLKITKGTDGITNANYPKYTSLSTLTYTDETAIKGKKYVYRIRSYTDDVGSELITSEETSFAEQEGWVLCTPTFSVNSEMNKQETKITSIDLDFDINFEDFGKNYIYLITYQRTQFGTADSKPDEEKIYAASTTKNFNSYTFSELEDTNIHGYYSYSLYILNSDADRNIIPANGSYIDKVSAQTIISVTDDATRIPEIKNFNVVSGYKNKFVLTWDKIDGAEYTVKWIPYENGQPGELGTKVLTSKDYTISGNTVTFNHEAISGDRRLYSLFVTKDGIPDSKVYSQISETLGTAVPVMAKPDYKTITVSWPTVQQIDTDYTYTATYSDNTSVINDSTTLTEENGIITLKINEPVGYNDPARSGLPITLKVVSSNSKTGDSTSAEINICTLGPALINTKAETENIQESRLQVTWNKIEGAAGYIIYRTKYNYNSDFTKWVFSKADTYFYNSENDIFEASGKLQTNGADVSTSRAKITLSGNTYTLVDYDCPQTDATSSYEERQAEIKWGAPYGYVVLPVKNSVKDFVFGDDSNYLKTTDEGEAGFKYTSEFTDQKTATKGFGFNIAAEKAQSLTQQVVTWAPPYFAKLGKSFTPELYKRSVNGNEKERWTKVNTNSAPQATTVSYYPSDDEKDETFEYFITYSNQLPTESIMNHLSKVLENNPKYDYTNVPSEQKNKGYLLYIPFTAGFGGENCVPTDSTYYSEVIDWNNLWDYSKRSIGPKSAKVYVFNPDRPVYAEGDTKKETPLWTELFSLKGDLSFNEDSNATNITIDQATESKVFVKPTHFTGDTIGSTKMGLTEGQLVVLRDYLHYYKIVFNNDEKLSIGNDMSISAYRNITPAELCVCVNYIISDGIYRAGIYNATLWNTSTKKIYGANNSYLSFFFAINSVGDYYDKVEWGFNNSYQHIFKNGHSSIDNSKDNKEFTSGFTLKSDKSPQEASSDEGTIYRLPKLSITVSHELKLESYSGTVTVSVNPDCGKKTNNWILINTVDGKEVLTANSKDYFLKVFPYDFGSKHENKDETANTNLQTYKSPWWN